MPGRCAAGCNQVPARWRMRDRAITYGRDPNSHRQDGLTSIVPAREALGKLKEGNRRFAAHERGSDPFLAHTPLAELATRQNPFAIILGCSDSRVPAEIVFDQGLGDLFVIRVAG